MKLTLALGHAYKYISFTKRMKRLVVYIPLMTDSLLLMYSHTSLLFADKSS